MTRRAGLLLPLFSCPSTTSWGLGDIGDVGPLTRWLAAAGLRVLQLLPLNEVAPGQQSPYSAISAMAIDPIFIDMAEVADFAALGGEAALASTDRETLAAIRHATRIDYRAIRRLKQSAQRAAFERFVDAEWRRESDRARELRTFVSEQAWWIEDYALFRALHGREGDDRPWTEWPPALRHRNYTSIVRARQDLAQDVLFHQYQQWLAAEQWRRARRDANGVALLGDLPFTVDADSADVWVRPDQFHLDITIGAPPDAFSADGQNWGTPLYRWDAIERDDFRWLRARARRGADLFDGYRIDHAVGFFRTYGRPKNGGPAFFTPPDEPAQRALGERVIEVFRGAGADIFAEDLGTVPDFVRASLTRLGVAGFKVFRWERHWHTAGRPFRDPSEYPPVSVAASGTHDTEPLAVWWDHAPLDERGQVSALPTVVRVSGGADLADAPYDARVRDVLIEALYASGSDLLLLPVQDVFGWRDRINEPATMNDENWTFRLPWPVDKLNEIPEALERKNQLAEWARTSGRVT
ncbi:MAG: 4-alpha-glucanotransferase [Acidobacteria bacterium]|nr:4-alpha-glucanotransferase [Acidobacteriota bacterium]